MCLLELHEYPAAVVVTGGAGGISRRVGRGRVWKRPVQRRSTRGLGGHTAAAADVDSHRTALGLVRRAGVAGQRISGVVGSDGLPEECRPASVVDIEAAKVLVLDVREHVAEGVHDWDQAVSDRTGTQCRHRDTCVAMPEYGDLAVVGHSLRDGEDERVVGRAVRG